MVTTSATPSTPIQILAGVRYIHVDCLNAPARQTRAAG